MTLELVTFPYSHVRFKASCIVAKNRIILNILLLDTFQYTTCIECMSLRCPLDSKQLFMNLFATKRICSLSNTTKKIHFLLCYGKQR